MEQIVCNKLWEKTTQPSFSIITAVYNRISYLTRPLESVKTQTFRDFEYIIIDDGSEETPDSIVHKYMEEVDFPVMYIKKDNGGAHTARNAGIKQARGQYIAILDSDDEFLPNALEVYYNAWNSIPLEKKDEYREVVARDCDENGNVLSTPYPPGINFITKEEADRIASTTGEHISVNRTDVLKANLFPEPEGVKFVDESICWRLLNQTYRSYYINDVIYRYYRVIPDSITHSVGKKKNIQHCINFLWNFRYQFLNRKLLQLGFRYSIKCGMMYMIFYNVLKIKNQYPQYAWATKKQKRLLDNLFMIVAMIPSYLIACYYINKRMV